MENFEFNIFADYSMIFVQDQSSIEIDQNIQWSDDDIKQMFYQLQGGFIIGTARNMEVPIFFKVHKTRPVLNYTDWDHIVESSIDLPSGTLCISGTSDYIEEYKEIKLPKGIYNVLICYAGLGTISEDGLEGNDLYTINVWSDVDSLSSKVIKQWNSDL